MQAILFIFAFVLILSVKAVHWQQMLQENKMVHRWSVNLDEIRFKERRALAELALQRYKKTHKREDVKPKEVAEDPNPDEEKLKAKGIKKPKRRSPALNFDEERPPDNSRFNLLIALQENNQEAQNVLQALLEELYGQQSFFEPALGAQLLEQLKRQREKIAGFTAVEQLATLEFEQPQWQRLWYTMLQGGADFDSLLWYITLNGAETKLNFLFAPRPLLSALLSNEQAVEKLMQLKETTLASINFSGARQKENPIDEDCLRRSEIAEHLGKESQAILTEYGCQEKLKGLDFHVGQPGKTLYIVDAELNTKIRRSVG